MLGLLGIDNSHGKILTDDFLIIIAATSAAFCSPLS